jgi:hypothetical protein
VEHVDLANKQLRIPGRKRSHRWRLVPIGVSLLPMLRAAIKGRAANEPLVQRWPNVRRDLHAAVARVNAELKRGVPPLPRVSPTICGARSPRGSSKPAKTRSWWHT